MNLHFLSDNNTMIPEKKKLEKKSAFSDRWVE